MSCHSIRISWHQRSTARPVSSVPLSETQVAGWPRRVMITLKFSHYPQSRRRGVGNERKALASEVINDSQDAEAAPIREGIRQEVEAPALVRTLWDRQRRPGAERTFAPATPTDLKPFLPVEPAELLVVHDDAFALEQDVKPPIAKPPAQGSQFAQTSPNNPIVWPDAPVAPTFGPLPSCTRPPFAHRICSVDVRRPLALRRASPFF